MGDINNINNNDSNVRDYSNGCDDLKVTVLEIKADELHKKINGKMDEIEEMTKEYSEIMTEIQSLRGNSGNHKKLLQRMIEKDNREPIDYNSCNTTEEMLSMITKELSYVQKLENDNLPDVGDNSEVWERIANAEKKLSSDSDEESSYTDRDPMVSSFMG